MRKHNLSSIQLSFLRLYTSIKALLKWRTKWTEVKQKHSWSIINKVWWYDLPEAKYAIEEWKMQSSSLTVMKGATLSMPPRFPSKYHNSKHSEHCTYTTVAKRSNISVLLKAIYHVKGAYKLAYSNYFFILLILILSIGESLLFIVSTVWNVTVKMINKYLKYDSRLVQRFEK